VATNPWLFLTIVTFIRVAMGAQFQSVGAAGPAIMAELGLDYAALGAIAGSYLGLGAFLALPAGWLSAHFGDRRILIAGLALMVAGGIGLGLAPGFALALTFRLLSGVGAVMLNIVVSKMVMDRFPDASLGTAIGVLLCAWPLGIGLGSIVLPYPVETIGWRGVMFLTAGICAGFLALAVTAIAPDAPRPASSRPLGASLRLGMSPRVIAAVIMAGLVWMLANAGYIILLGFAPSYYVEHGMSLATAGWVLSLASFATIPVSPLGGWLGHRIGHPMLLTAACYIIVAPLFLLVPDSTHPALLMVILGTVFALPCGLIVALPALVLRPDQRAVGMGLFYSVFYAGLGIFSPFAGWVRDLTAIDTAPFIVAAILTALTAAALWAFILLARPVRLHP
jgi:predicted MFS family arabinose efflux permease